MSLQLLYLKTGGREKIGLVYKVFSMSGIDSTYLGFVQIITLVTIISEIRVK